MLYQVGLSNKKIICISKYTISEIFFEILQVSPDFSLWLKAELKKEWLFVNWIHELEKSKQILFSWTHLQLKTSLFLEIVSLLSQAEKREEISQEKTPPHIRSAAFLMLFFQISIKCNIKTQITNRKKYYHFRIIT